MYFSIASSFMSEDPMVSVSDLVDDPSRQSEFNAGSRHADSSFVDDIFEPDKRLERMNKFRPKLCGNSKKAVPKLKESCVEKVPSSASQVMDSFGIKSTMEVSVGASCLEESVFSSVSSAPHVVQDLGSDSEIPISSNVLNGDAQRDGRCSQEENVKDMVCHLKSLDDDAQADSNFAQKDIASNSSSCSGGIEPACTLNPEPSSQPMAISSVVTNNLLLVNNGHGKDVEASHISESHVNLQACSDNLERLSTTGLSSVDCIDDLVPIPSTGKCIGKFRPKPTVRLKDVKKTKSVSFIIPNPGESAASVNCQTTSNPTETAPSFIEIMNEGNMEDGLISLANSKKDNHVNLGGLLSEAVMNISSLDPTDQHVSEFMEEQVETRGEITRVATVLGTSKLDILNMESGATASTSVCPVDITSGYNLLDSPSLHSEPLDPHCLGLTSGDLADSLTKQMHGSIPSNSSEERAGLPITCDVGFGSLADNDNFCMAKGMQGLDDVVEPILEGASIPNTTQSDENGKFPWKLRQRNKFRSNNTRNNIVNEDWIAENTGVSESDEENGGDVYKEEDMPKKKKRKASCKSFNRKKSSEKPDPIVKDPPKKRLPHGTRRRSAKRQVNEALLDIPDDELNRSQLAIRDLIRLAEFKERTSNKEAAVLKNSSTNLSDPFAKINHFNGGNYNEEHEEDPNGDGANESIQLEASRLNYHSYMKRPKQTRWSKIDTELFYQSIRQFGTDFAMIQLLFTNRSRQQVKAKFKNEQRKHPLEIADALVRRGKDNSQFEKVIQHLKEQKLNKDACSEQTSKSEDGADRNEGKTEQEVDSFEGGEAWDAHKSDDVYEF